MIHNRLREWIKPKHRILSYCCRENDDKATVRAMLAANLESQLRSIFALKARGQVDVRVIVQRSVSAAGPDVFRGITVEVQNHSSSTIFLNSITFPCAKGGSIFPQRAYNGVNEPSAVQPGNNHLLLFREDEFVEWVAKHELVAAAATDKIGRKWTSDPAAFQKLLDQIRRDRKGEPAVAGD